MKRFLLSIVCVCFAINIGYAQATDETKLKLKSGVEVRGEIVEMIPDVSITIKNSFGDTFYYRMDEVARIEMGKQEKNKVREARGLGNFKGYRGIVDISYSAGAGDAHAHSATPGTSLHQHQMTVSSIHGYNFGSHLYIGIGVGVSFSSLMYANNEIREHIDVPVFIHLRSALLKGRRVAPFVALNAGYNINCTSGYYYSNPEAIQDNEGNYYALDNSDKLSGVYIEPTLGAEFRINRKHAISVGLTAPLIFPTEKTKGVFIAKNIGVKIGYSF